MFKNRALQVKMVKTTDSSDTTDFVAPVTIDPQEINDLLKEQIRNIGVTVVAAAAAITVLATAREVIVNNTNPQYR